MKVVAFQAAANMVTLSGSELAFGPDKQMAMKSAMKATIEVGLLY